MRQRVESKEQKSNDACKQSESNCRVSLAYRDIFALYLCKGEKSLFTYYLINLGVEDPS
jgi:hypothetical protein